MKVIVFDSDDQILAFESLESAKWSLEFPEVEAGEYRAYGVDGQPLEVTSIDQDVRLAPTGAPDMEAFISQLSTALEKRGIPFPDVEPEALVTAAVAAFEHWQREQGFWRRLARRFRSR